MSSRCIGSAWPTIRCDSGKWGPPPCCSHTCLLQIYCLRAQWYATSNCVAHHRCNSASCHTKTKMRASSLGKPAILLSKTYTKQSEDTPNTLQGVRDALDGYLCKRPSTHSGNGATRFRVWKSNLADRADFQDAQRSCCARLPCHKGWLRSSSP